MVLQSTCYYTTFCNHTTRDVRRVGMNATLTLYLQNQTLSYINLFTMDHQLKCRAGATFTIYILQMDIDNNYLLLWMRKFQVQHSLLLLYTMNVREIDAEFEKLLMINIRKVRMSIIINSIYIWCPLKTHANMCYSDRNRKLTNSIPKIHPRSIQFVGYNSQTGRYAHVIS